MNQKESGKVTMLRRKSTEKVASRGVPTQGPTGPSRNRGVEGVVTRRQSCFRRAWSLGGVDETGRPET